MYDLVLLELFRSQAERMNYHGQVVIKGGAFLKPRPEANMAFNFLILRITNVFVLSKICTHFTNKLFFFKKIPKMFAFNL